MKKFTTLEEAKEWEDKRDKGLLTGYFESADSENYKTFAQVISNNS